MAQLNNDDIGRVATALHEKLSKYDPDDAELVFIFALWGAVMRDRKMVRKYNIVTVDDMIENIGNIWGESLVERFRPHVIKGGKKDE